MSPLYPARTADPAPPDPASAVNPPALRRDLSLLSASAIGMGAIIGAGISVVSGVAAGVAGPAFLVGLGVLLSQTLGISRMMLAMARRKDLPGALAHVHPRHGTPDRAVLVTGALLVAVAMAGRLEAILSGAAFTILLYYAITNLAALRLASADR